MTQVLDMPIPCKRPLIERMVFNGLVFNMSWEDPEMDRQALNVKPSDRVISITSAGCNPLNLLCEGPSELVCVDGNPAQNAVMELKLAAIQELDHEAFFDIFAARNPGRVNGLYKDLLRPHLSERAKRYWDRNLKIAAKGLYRYGRIGLFCRILRGYFKMLGIRKKRLEEFFETETLEEQSAYYMKHLYPKLWGRTSRALLNFKPFIYLAGVHPNQFKIIDDNQGIFAYVRERVDHVCTKVPIRDNYFLSISALGRFIGENVPPYLKKENYPKLKNLVDRVKVVNGWLGPYLDTRPPESMDKFNLLDIFDWMPPELFESTMKSVVRAASKGAVLIYRSGLYLKEPPQSLMHLLQGHPELSRNLLEIDRSALYGSFNVYSVPGN